MAKLKQEQNHYLEASRKLWEAFCIINIIACANEKETTILDIQTALRGVIALMDEGLDHLGEV